MKLARPSLHFRAARLVRAVVLLMLAVSSLTGPSAAWQGNQPGPELEIDAPQRAVVGELIQLRLRVRRAVNIAGYETALLFDAEAAEYAGLEQRDNDLKKIGRDVSPLTAVDLPGGAAIGLFSCPVQNCVTRPGPKIERGAQGTIQLARVFLVAIAPGTLEVRLDATKFVDSGGNPVEVAVPNPTVTIRVDPGPGEPEGGDTTPAPRHYPAPGSMWTLATTAGSTPGPFDLTGDGLVTHADAMEVALEWELTRHAGAPCGDQHDPTRDINHDGCIDVADLQLVAAHFDVAGGTGGTDNAAGAETGDGASPAAEAGQTATSATYTVNATTDGVDANVGDGICATSFNVCTLRAAIQEANAHAGPDQISFNIGGSGVRTIQLAGRLPTLLDATGPTTIDGYTQPGATPNTDSLVSNAVLRVEVAGNGETAHDGFVITSANNVIRGLAIYKMKRAVWIYGSGATGNVLTGNFIGTSAAGTYLAPSLTNGAHGVHIEQGAAQTRVGGTQVGERNVISGNGQMGVGIWHEASDSNVILNNLVGLNPAGTNRLPNRRHGLDFNFGSASNVVGGTGPGERNVSSGNDYSGVEVSHTPGTTQNRVVGNFLGTDATGNSAPEWAHNGYTGITVEDGASQNTITHNVIGNSKQGGLQITGLSTSHNQVAHNRIGVSANGSPIGNSLFGVRADGTSNTIGPGNTIAYNQFSGIIVRENDKDFNTFTQNSTFGNGGLGIELLPTGPNPNDDGDGDTGPNEQLNYPVLSSATTGEVTGTACGGCLVEIFIADDGAGAYGEGKTFVGSATASGNGSFTAAISGAANGNYLTATVTDADGNTSEFSLNVQVSDSGPTPTPTPTPTNTPTPGPTPTPTQPSSDNIVVSDTFSRNLTDSWGSAETGGNYSLHWGTSAAADFDVNGTAGTIRVGQANLGREAFLQGVSAQDVDVTFRFQTDKVSTGDSQDVMWIARLVNTNTMYRGRIRLYASGDVYVQANRGVSGSWMPLGALTKVAGVTHTPGAYLQVHGQVVGTNPTTIRMNVWPAGQAEPSGWQFSVTDSTSALQGPGGTGFRVSLSSAATNAPILFTFDDYLVTTASAP